MEVTLSLTCEKVIQGKQFGKGTELISGKLPKGIGPVELDVAIQHGHVRVRQEDISAAQAPKPSKKKDKSGDPGSNQSPPEK